MKKNKNRNKLKKKKVELLGKGKVDITKNKITRAIFLNCFMQLLVYC